MAARTLLLKLERRGYIELPPRQRPSSNQCRNRCVPVVEHVGEPIRDSLSDLRPLSAGLVVPGSGDLRLFKGLLGRYHYLGHRNTVGENLRRKGKRKSGGQPGHTGHTLKMAKRPADPQVHHVTECEHCGRSLAGQSAENVDPASTIINLRVDKSGRRERLTS